jgi:hypothetical protein
MTMNSAIPASATRFVSSQSSLRAPRTLKPGTLLVDGRPLEGDNRVLHVEAELGVQAACAVVVGGLEQPCSDEFLRLSPLDHVEH